MPRPPRLAVMLGRGLLRRCPRCGGGRLFASWFRMHDACPTCGLRFDRGDAFFLGAFVVNFGVTEALLAVVLVALFAATLPDPPVLTLALIAAAVTVVVPLIFYPFSKTIWAAIELQLRGGSDELTG